MKLANEKNRPRLTWGRLAYLAWFEPLARLRQSIREGGPLEQWKTASGRRAMRAAAATLPPPQVAADAPALEVYFLTGARYWEQTVFCAWSLTAASRRPLEAVIIDDGTLEDAQFDAVRRVVARCSRVTRDAAEARCDDRLPPDRYPKLHECWRRYPHIRKIIDPHLLPDGPPVKLVIDSDLLFFRRPDALLDWAERPERPLHALDVETSYGYPMEAMATLAGATIAPLVNVGLTGLRTSEIDWDRLEHWSASLVAAFGLSYYLEQALVAMMVAGRACSVLPAADYVTLPRPPEDRDCAAVMHHYVAGSKPAYFRRNWRTARHRLASRAAERGATLP